MKKSIQITVCIMKIIIKFANMCIDHWPLKLFFLHIIFFFFCSNRKIHNYKHHLILFEAMSMTRTLCRSVTCVSRFTSPLATQRDTLCTCWTGLPMGCLTLCSLGTISFSGVVVRTNYKLNFTKCRVKQIKNPDFGRWHRRHSAQCTINVLKIQLTYIIPVYKYCTFNNFVYIYM